MQGVIRKWGNSAAVRIPASVLEAAGVRPDQAVDVREENGRIVIEAVHEQRYDLVALISGITDQNCHDPVEFGPPTGIEAW